MLGAVALSLCLLSCASARGEDRPSGAFDVLSYSVSLTPDFATGRVRGRTTIALVGAIDRLESVVFSANALEVVAVASSDAASVLRDGEQLLVVLREPLERGERAELILDFSGRPERGLHAAGGFVWTDYWACDWMICRQDDPGDKAMLSLELVLPASVQSVGPGEFLGAAPQGPDASTHTWLLETPHSSYLFAFAAGPFETETLGAGGEIALSVLSAAGDADTTAAALADTGAMLAFFEERAGIGLSRASYSQVIVPGATAQETAGFSLIGADHVAALVADPREDWIVAHELAHQWWGNLVTCVSWRHFWLNEGMATFMVAAWKEERWGRDAYEREMTLARRRLARAAEGGFDVPLTYAGPFPDLSTRRAIAYSKGALFLDALRRRLGEERFWRGIRVFTHHNIGGAVDSSDFQTAMETAAGEDLSDLFAEWVYS